MRTPVILAVVCGLVLGGAYFASRLLVSDVPAPPVLVVNALPEPPRTVELAPSPPPARPELSQGDLEAALIAKRQGAVQPVNPAPAPGFPRLVEAAPAPAPEVVDSPFQGDSKELDYAEELLAEPNTDVERVRSAYEVLKRCVQQEPDNQRCVAGLEQARQRVFPPPATELKATPTLKSEPPHLVRPPK